jgi:2,4-dienoyl-CoA reductase-like NADH-dependent reductase (Old Yellow Enzyme family)/NADPH-dependent glutamate synthase beta subunit-like oxidoreductase
MSSDLFPNIFSSIKINNLVIKNRIVMPAMATNFAGVYGDVTDDMINYYKSRAKGGVGLIIVENTNIDFPFGSAGATQLRIDNDRYVPGLSKLAESIKQYGAKVCLQINHAGASAMSERIGEQYIVGPSDIPAKKNGEKQVPLSKDQIYVIIKKFGMAARRAKDAGFDMIEIHGGHSYLIAQFLSPLTNKRNDEFGGSLKNMSRFIELILKEVRNKVGNDYPISLRINGDEFIEGGRNLSGTIEILNYIAPYIDILNITAGTAYNYDKHLEPIQYEEGWRVYLSNEIKKHINIPTITVGNIRSPEFVEDILSTKKADMVAIGRGLICDPNWVMKVYNGDINILRKCISCNIGCVGNRVFGNLPIKCTINPEIISDTNVNYNKTNGKTIVVIGGGPSGLEAACYAAECGFNVYLFEKENEIGGLLTLIKELPKKKKMDYIVQYFKERASRINNLQIFLGSCPSIQEIMDLNPDFVINATGSIPNIPCIKGLKEIINSKESNVYTINTLLDNIDKFNKKEIRDKKVVIVGGGAVGLDCAEYFAEADAEITIIEMKDNIASDMEYVTKNYMIQNFENHKVKIFTETCLLEIKENEMICIRDKEELKFNFDIAIICLGLKPNNQNYLNIKEILQNNNVLVYNIGDSYNSRKIINGIHEGRNIVKYIIDSL